MKYYLRIALNILLIALGIAMFALLYGQVGIFVMIPIALMVLFVSVPLTIRYGVKLVITEKVLNDSRIVRGFDPGFDKQNLLKGYAIIFFFLALFPSLSFIIPIRNAWMYYFIPILIICSSVMVMTLHTWESFGFKKANYWLIYSGSIVFLSMICALVRKTAF